MSKKPVTAKIAAYENPLIPNARLRQTYRAILRAHLLGQALSPAQRALTATREAALVSTALDLTPRDLVLDAFSSPALDFLRGTPLHRALNPKSNSSSRILADAGSPSRLASPSDPAARIHAALGAAASLQSAAALAKKTAKESDFTDSGSAVVLSNSISGEVPTDIWKSSLTHAAQHDLPIIFTVLASASKTKPSHAAKAASDPTTALRAIAHKAGVPAIPVDAADPVALYRVAQESIGHARIGGGPALIQCIAFPAPASRSHSRSAAANPAVVHPAIAHIEDYILSRSIATRAWMDREASSFAAQVRALKSASK